MGGATKQKWMRQISRDGGVVKIDVRSFNAKTVRDAVADGKSRAELPQLRAELNNLPRPIKHEMIGKRGRKFMVRELDARRAQGIHQSLQVWTTPRNSAGRPGSWK